MRIEQTNSIPNQDFGARAISKGVIKRKIPFTPFYKKVDAYFVELRSSEDSRRFYKYALQHNTGTSTESIAHNLRHKRKHSQTFILTTQSDNFEHIKPEKIMGACEGTYISSIYKPNSKFRIDNLETQSEHNEFAHHPTKRIKIFGFTIKCPIKHKGIGTEILKKLVTHLSEQSVDRVEVLSLEEAMPFYKSLKKWQNEAHSFSLERKNFFEFANN